MPEPSRVQGPGSAPRYEKAPKPPPLIQLTVTMTAYNSLAAQTDDSPHTTATMTRTRPGVVAVSRDLLAGEVPYGTKLRIERFEGRGCNAWVPGSRGILPDVFVVEDTMHARKRNQIDVWLPQRSQALLWGRCEAVVTVLPG